MDCRALNKLLLSNFPELKFKYDEEVSWQEGADTGSHVVYGDVLYPYLKRAIEAVDTQTIKKIFDFLEYALSFGDKYCDEVVAFSILEMLADNALMIHTLKPYMGERVNTIFNQIICAQENWEVDSDSMSK